LSADSLRILNPGLRIANGNKNGEERLAVNYDSIGGAEGDRTPDLRIANG